MFTITDEYERIHEVEADHYRVNQEANMLEFVVTVGPQNENLLVFAIPLNCIRTIRQVALVPA